MKYRSVKVFFVISLVVFLVALKAYAQDCGTCSKQKNGKVQSLESDVEKINSHVNSCSTYVSKIQKKCKKSPDFSDQNFLKNLIKNIKEDPQCNMKEESKRNGIFKTLLFEDKVLGSDKDIQDNRKFLNLCLKLSDLIKRSLFNRDLNFFQKRAIYIQAGLRGLKRFHKHPFWGSLAQDMSKLLAGKRKDLSKQSLTVLNKINDYMIDPTPRLGNLCRNFKDNRDDQKNKYNGKAIVAKTLMDIYVFQKNKVFSQPRSESNSKGIFSSDEMGEFKKIFKMLVNNDFEGILLRKFKESTLRTFLKWRGGENLRSFPILFRDVENNRFSPASESRTLENFRKNLASSIISMMAQNSKVTKPLRGHFGGKAIFSEKVNDKVYFNIIIPAVCETGDFGSYLPMVGRLEVNDKIRPINHDRTGEFREWSYVIRDKDGKKVPKYNGISHEDDVTVDKNFGYTKVMMTLPQHYERRRFKDLMKNLTLRIKCDGKIMTYKLEVPQQKGRCKVTLPLQNLNSPPYEKIDQDGIRRMLYIVGHKVDKPSYNIKHTLEKQNYKCKEKEEVKNIRDEFYKILGEQTRPVDFLIKDAHLYGGEAFRVDKCLGEKYICTKKIREGLKAEVIILNRDAYTDRDGAYDIYYNDFLPKLTPTWRRTPLVYANMCCSGLNKSAYEMKKVLSPELVQNILTTQTTHYNGDYNTKVDSAIAILEGFALGLNYDQIASKYPVFKKENTLLPNNPLSSRLLHQKMGLLSCQKNIRMKHFSMNFDYKKELDYFKKTGQLTYNFSLEALSNGFSVVAPSKKFIDFITIFRYLMHHGIFIKDVSLKTKLSVLKQVLKISNTVPLVLRESKKIGSKSIPLLIEYLSGLSNSLHDEAYGTKIIIALSQMGEEGIKALMMIGDDYDGPRFVRETIKKILVDMGSKVIPILINALKVGYKPNYVLSILNKMGNLGDRTLANILDNNSLTYLHKRVAKVFLKRGRKALKKVDGKLRKKLIPFLTPMLNQGFYKRKKAAAKLLALGDEGIEALINIRGKKAIRNLRKFYDNMRYRDIQDQVMKAFRRLGKVAIPSLMQMLLEDSLGHKERKAITTVLEEIVKKGPVGSIKLFEKKNNKTKHQRIQKVVKILLSVDIDMGASKKIERINVIVNVLGEQARPALTKEYERNRSIIARDALLMLNIKKGPALLTPKKKESIKELVDLLHNSDPKIHKRAMIELKKRSKDAVPFLINILKDKNFDLFSHAEFLWRVCSTLGMIGKDAIPMVANLIKTKQYADRDSYWAHKALFIIGKDAIPALIESLKDKNSWHTYQACKVLAHLGKDSVPHLVKLIRDSKDIEVLNSAFGVLQDIGRDALPELNILVNHENPIVRNQARQTLNIIMRRNS